MIKFTVDAALLRELGERLVGRPYIALAELVKNSYDADATTVELHFKNNTIEVADNGNGMDFDSFRDFWMRIGSPHKESQRTSPRFGRPLTGSKGVGRLAVQLLGSKVTLHTVDRDNSESELTAHVVWSEAIASKELTEATAKWERLHRTSTFPGDSPHGTRLVLSELQHEWTSEVFVLLARELWALEPPFEVGESSPQAFHVSLHHPNAAAVTEFEQQMKAVLKLWSARILGKLLPPSEPESANRTVRVVVRFRDGSFKRTDHVIENCAIDQVEYEIRVFSLRHRQPYGINVRAAREYLRTYGGVGVYDSGFRLPYYGADSDWLNVARDAGRRLSRSELLPDELQVTEGLQYIPTNERLFGIVNINTSHERRAGAVRRGRVHDALAIQVTRDRLADNRAYRNLVEIVRFGIDLYANEEAARAFIRSQQTKPIEPLNEHLDRIEDVLQRHETEIPPPVRRELKAELDAIVEAGRSEATDLARQAGLLGALATAGIATLAYEHETSKQLLALEDAVARLRHERLSPSERREVASQLERWVERARATRNLFGHLLTTDARDERPRLRARRVVRQIADQVRVLVPGLVVKTDLSDDLRLPPGSMAEWAAIFQNLFINAANSMLDVGEPLIRIHAEEPGARRALYVEDVGNGVDLASAEELFRPFVRRQTISPERQGLGMGGTGLGLPIVRMVSKQLNVRVNFVPPSPPYSTCVELAWTERR